MNVEFNHLFVTLDVESVEAVNKSEFIANEFCNLSRRKTEADSESWIGTYLYGIKSYIELFAPGGAEGVKEGFSGIGFSTAQIGEIDKIEEKLKKLAPERIRRGMRIRKMDNGEVPWFYYLTVEQPENSGFSSWLMEFHPDYLARKGVKLDESGLVDRGVLLKPESGLEAKRLLYNDISEVDLELTPAEHNDLKLLLRAFGYDLSVSGETVHYRSNNFLLKVAEQSAPVFRVRQAISSLTWSWEGEQEFRFGDHTMLSISKKTGRWLFGQGIGSD